MLNSLVWAYMAVVSGLPATVAPVALNEDNLPIGVQIIGASLEDRTTIAFAKGLSKLIGGFVPPPGYDN
jgi:amidase